MPQYLPIPVVEDFGGIDCTSTPDAVQDLNTPDSRNEDISTPGAETKRNGLVKQNTTAYSYPIYAMIEVKIKDVKYTAYINSNGDFITL